MAPFSEIITLNKTIVKDKNGIPSPPILFTLQQSQQNNIHIREELAQLKFIIKDQEPDCGSKHKVIGDMCEKLDKASKKEIESMQKTLQQ